MDGKGKRRMVKKEACGDHHEMGMSGRGTGEGASSEEEEEPQQRKGIAVADATAEKRKKVGMESGRWCQCQVEGCGADMGDAKPYHRRHKVCKAHANAEFVLVAGSRHRFCQQCSRFHDLSEFDDSKRSCRRRLAGHNERRRKSTCPSESNPQGSGQEMATYKHVHIT